MADAIAQHVELVANDASAKPKTSRQSGVYPKF